MRVLVVEDEIKIANFISMGLKERSYAVDVANNGEDGLFLAESNPYDIIVLDIMLPKIDGISICQKLRFNKNDVPILILTARDDVKDKIQGLDAGADDYLTKPFSLEEFLARVRALSRRKQIGKTTILKVADLELDQITHRVTRAGKYIVLTSTEYSLLEYLMLHVQQVVTRTMILEHVWDLDSDPYTNIITVYINYLRKKIDTGFEKKLIHSIRGTGYILKD